MKAPRSHARRFTVFAGVGAINTLVDIGAFVCLYQFAGLDVILSNVLAFLLAVANSYIFNRFITFRDRSGGSLRRMGAFFVVAVAAMIVSTAIVFLASQFIHPVFGKLIATVASTFINYLGSHHLVFTRERRQLRPGEAK
ncbi:MAG TPA: GtrA family protein [Dongiaceae bacterium]|nr:GtrA family protein [Dongiaceae bacterium]